MSQPKVVLPFLAGAALIVVLWFSFRNDSVEPLGADTSVVQPAPATSPP